MKKFFLFCTIALSIAQISFAQSQKYSRVKVFTDDAGMVRLAQAGIAADHGEYKHGYSFTTDFSEAEFQKIKQLGFSYEVLIPDVQKFYVDRNKNTDERTQQNVSIQSVSCSSVVSSYAVPSHFALGTMGGFFTLNEIYTELDNMATLFPTLVKPRAVIDSALTTPEGRYVYWVRISNNPNVNQNNKPQILYTALHHAREPAGASQQIMYMYYLLENYNTNPEIKYLIDNMELYFVTCVNPDGYNYNHTTNPNGGGMWRKNRKNNGDGTFGIDLNRNYGQNWGYDNIGSSNQTSSDTYRGPSGFSEPETQLMKEFCNVHHFGIAINYHTYFNVIVCPWGYRSNFFTPDSILFNTWGPILTADNGFSFGTANQTVGYTANGDSDDWMYGEQISKPKVIAMTPEAGDQNDGFYPAQTRIIPICQQNLPMDLNAARLLLAYGKAKDKDPRYISQANGYFHYDFQRLGLDSPATYTVNIQALSSYITSVGSGHSYSLLSSLQTVADSISYTLNPATPQGTALRYVVSVNNGAFTWRDTLTKIFGQTAIVLSNNGTSITGWTSVGGWGTTTSSYYSAPSSITDSPSGNYATNANTSLTTTTPVSLVNVLSAELTFEAKWALETQFDFTEVQASSNSGTTWTALCGKYTANNNNLDNGNPTYTGFQSSWVKEEMPLDNFVGQNILIRYRLSSDQGVDYDGFYFDDLKVVVVPTSSNGVNEVSSNDFFSVYPNPTTGQFTIHNSQFKIQNVLITDILGNIINSMAVNRQSSVFDLTGQPKGIYFIKVTDENGNFGVKKIVLQ